MTLMSMYSEFFVWHVIDLYFFTVLSSRWAYELACLLSRGSGMEPRVCMTHCLGTLISKD